MDETKIVKSENNSILTKLLGKGPVWIMILVVGPLAIPMLIYSPHFSKTFKWVVSLLLIVVTVALYYVTDMALEPAAELGVVI